MKTDKSLEFKEWTVNEGLQQQIVTLLDTGQTHAIQNNLKKSFESFRQLLLMIDGYDYEGKDNLKELNNILTDYFDELSSGSYGNRKDVLILQNQKRMELRVLLEQYQSEIIKKYVTLGLWFSVKITSNDIDVGFSDQFFNSEYTGLQDKKKELSKLKGKELVELIRPNILHECYSALLIKRALEG